jgi:hypothetical protein
MMTSYPSFTVKVDMGQSVLVRAGSQPATVGEVEAGRDVPRDVIAEVLFKLAFAFKEGNTKPIPLNVSGKKIIRDSDYVFPERPMEDKPREKAVRGEGRYVVKTS